MLIGIASADGGHPLIAFAVALTGAIILLKESEVSDDTVRN